MDIREEGSKNAGASNVVLMFGKKLGLITAITDIMKAYFAGSHRSNAASCMRSSERSSSYFLRSWTYVSGNHEV